MQEQPTAHSEQRPGSVLKRAKEAARVINNYVAQAAAGVEIVLVTPWDIEQLSADSATQSEVAYAQGKISDEALHKDLDFEAHMSQKVSGMLDQGEVVLSINFEGKNEDYVDNAMKAFSEATGLVLEEPSFKNMPDLFSKRMLTSCWCKIKIT